MSGERDVRIIPTRTPESKQFVADVERAMAITPALNRLTYADTDAVRSLFEDLIDGKVGEHFRLIPPFYTDCGKNIRVGDRVFINQNCTIYALAQVTIGDDVMIGPNVSLITSEHPVGENSVVAAGSVVTRDVPANTLVGGNPARVIRSIEGE
jgi:acetyltransferase-like isoleucine patch superfamily enzyme